MKKIKIIIITGLLVIIGCSTKAEKPKITLNDYATQALVANGIVRKIMSETDYKKMHGIALAIESSRSISCVLVSDECNLLGIILNRIVYASQKGMPSAEESMEIYKLINQLDQEFKKGRESLTIQWAEYLKATNQLTN